MRYKYLTPALWSSYQIQPNQVIFTELMGNTLFICQIRYLRKGYLATWTSNNYVLAAKSLEIWWYFDEVLTSNKNWRLRHAMYVQRNIEARSRIIIVWKSNKCYWFLCVCARARSCGCVRGHLSARLNVLVRANACPVRTGPWRWVKHMVPKRWSRIKEKQRWVRSQ